MPSRIPVSVLHVEDDPADVHIIQSLLENNTGNLHSYNVTHAPTLAKALLRLDKEAYNAVLLDLNLPDGKGIDNLKALKRYNPDMPVIVITGTDDERTALEALREGAQEYIVKNHGDAHVIQRIIQSSIFRKRIENDLFKQAHFDALTGLPNRLSFEKVVQPMIQRARRWDHKEALMFIDLNGFKNINDTHGHEAGNAILKEVASRLQKTLRESDLIARYAGDEFVVYMDSGGKTPVTESMCRHVAEKILSAVKAPCVVDDKKIEIGLSIGIAIYPDSGQTFDVLLKNADRAMYIAKNCPEKKYYIFGEKEAEQRIFSLESSAAKAANSNRSRRLVMIIDDSPEDRLIYRKILTSSPENFEVVEAESVRDAFRIMEKCSPHCILLDYGLPGLNGLEFLQKIRTEKRNIDAAIIVVTGRQDRNTAIEAMKLGAKDYILKGQVKDTEIIKIIADAIEKNTLENELSEYQKELERSNKELSEFAHTVAHDLKAPMRKILMFCELLEEKGESFLDPESLDYIRRMEVSSARMQNLIDNLLNYAQIMKSHEERKIMDMGTLAHEVLDDLEAWLDYHKATVIIKTLPTLPLYPVRIKQLLSNLIVNAIKYRRNDTLPVVTIDSEMNGEECIISVRDNGMGIAQPDMAKIFQPFKRLHAAEDIEGTGLGLSICQKVVEKHAGKIWVVSKKGEGSTFLFSLPL